MPHQARGAALIGSVAAPWVAGQPLHQPGPARGLRVRAGHGGARQPGAADAGAETVLSAGFALVPLMLDADAPGKEILPAVAITIFGGLVSATGRLAAPASGRVTAVLQLTTEDRKSVV